MVERKQLTAPGEEHQGPVEGALLAGIALLVLLPCLPATEGPIGIETAQGGLHESFGYMTFVLGTLALGLVARILR